MRDLILSFSAALQRRFASTPPISLSHFDICAIVPGYKRTECFNDLLWKEELRCARQNPKILAVLYGSLDLATRDAMGNRVDQWITLAWTRPSPFLLSAMHWFWPMFPIVLFRSITRFLASAVRHKTSINYIARVLSVLLDASKMEAIFRIARSRIFWTSNGIMDQQSLGGILAMHRLGGVSIGTVWSSCMMPLVALPLHNSDVLFMWGPRHAKIFTKSI